MIANRIKSCWNCKNRTTERFPSETGSEFAKYFYRYGCKIQSSGKTVVNSIDSKKFKEFGCELWEDKNKKRKRKDNKVKYEIG